MVFYLLMAIRRHSRPCTGALIIIQFTPVPCPSNKIHSHVLIILPAFSGFITHYNSISKGSSRPA